VVVAERPATGNCRQKLAFPSGQAVMARAFGLESDPLLDETPGGARANRSSGVSRRHPDANERGRTSMTEGRIIQGRYRLVSMLGQGGMGSVWRAVHLELGTPVAVKLIDPEAADSRQALARFKREAQSAASLRGTNVVQILDYGEDDGIAYIVMELLEGESLGARLSRKAPLSAAETAWILGQVGKALARAHALNIVHRDLKPDNIFIVRDGDEEVAKVLDFGIAKMMSTEAFTASIQTRSGAILGTPHYMSPEQASGRASVDHRSDIWSLGVIGFECITGCRPFAGSTLGGLVIAICAEPIVMPSKLAAVPPGFDEWFACCVCRDPAGRFQSVAEAMVALRAVCGPSLAPIAAEPLLAPSGYVPTLPNGERGLVQRPLAQAIGNAAGVAHGPAPVEGAQAPQTVSAASRTLGAAQQRRSVWWSVALGLLLFGGGTATAIALRQTSLPATGASAQPPSTGLDASNAPAQAQSPPAAVTARDAVLVPSLVSSSSASPPAATPAPLHPAIANRAVLGRAQGADAVRASRSGNSDEGVPASASASVTEPREPSSAPEDRPASEPAEATLPPSPARRRNIEDRLAF
jgi:eukaryotic-like serine/threonine-protein kinase